MKKLLGLISLIALCGCAESTGEGNKLTRLENEPKNCKFLYTLDSSATTYNLEGAYDYLEKSILEQKTLGDSYYVVEQDTLKNPGAIFGPKNTFKLKVKVYNCQK